LPKNQKAAIFTASPDRKEAMLIAIMSGFVFALGLVPLGKYFKGRAVALSALLPLSLFLYFLSLLPKAAGGEALLRTYRWAPSFGVELSFHADGLGLLFALIISGVGTLVFLYSANYLKGHEYLGRFYGYLGMFMGAMLGLVLSDNLISLFIFWELTSISSFFLIGFNNEEEPSRKSALVALGITGFGGLLLLAGALAIGAAGGSYSIQELLGSGIELSEHSWYIGILCLVFGAAFTKSAQFPFHFWLPGAMKAPTPVSTYLHSATMVKAGIYLLMRFTPLLGGHDYWHVTLYIIGGITMFYSAVHILFRTDLKGILAYSTISALGILVFLIGLGTPKALLAAAVFILVHALYKAALFLITGIIDHETGTRDVTRLAGLGKVMLPVGIAGILAALSNAGIPPTFGFVGKDLIYEATLHAGELGIALTAVAILTNILLLYGGFIAGVKPFVGRLPEAYQQVHLPSPLLWVPPVLLAGLSLLFGLWPQAIEGILIKPAVVAMGGGHDFHLKLWHGFNLVLLLSGATIGGGLLLYWLFRPSSRLEARITSLEPFSPQGAIEKLAERFYAFSIFSTRKLQSGYLRYYVLIILCFIILLIGYKLFSGVNIYIDYSRISGLTWYEAATLGIMLISTLYAVFTQSRLTAVAAMGVVGYAICILFVFYSAPDLAMTQFTIDTLTVILFVLVLYRLPRYLKLSRTRNRLRDGFVALSFGTLITVLALEVLNAAPNREVGNYYADNAYLLAKGKNVVNVILVDFRGIDTLVEIMVLTVAAIGVYSLLKMKAMSD
jgi:multicomponent Na+:H+ antiporter subunit A